MAYDAGGEAPIHPTTCPLPPVAARVLGGASGTAAIFDMRSAAGRKGAGLMLARLGRPAAARAEAAARERAERERRTTALRRAQARIGLRLLSGEEWAREIAVELAAMDAEAGR
ncbi:hypothetical protein [Caulobacter sp. S45]|jgi:hypothetical protein|uniref:hypothetical protein n=1 Tax=Caulobacter sp. S45 TaxID=1641861 RepID=UPI00131C2997|nr:hypothetical protein [Caulobacter sp. S45]